MAPISIVYWLVWLIWSFCGVGRNYPFNGPWVNAGGDILLVILLFIIGLTVFPVHL